VLLVYKGPLEHQHRPDSKVLLVLLELQVFRELLVIQVEVVLQEPPELLVYKAQLD